MKYLLMTILMISFVACNEGDGETASVGQAGKVVRDGEMEKPTERMDKISYQMGRDFFNSTSRDSVGINIDYFVKGYLDTKMQRDGLVDDKEIEIIMQEFYNQQQVRQGKAMAKSNDILQRKTEEAKIKSPLLIEQVSNDPNFTKHESGIYYRVISKNEDTSEPLITKDATVIMHMKTTLATGDMIDDSRDPSMGGGQPRTIRVVDLFPGFIAGLELMRVGDHFEIVVPADLALGDKGDGRLIPGHCAMILDIEVFDVIQ